MIDFFEDNVVIYGDGSDLVENLGSDSKKTDNLTVLSRDLQDKLKL